MLGHGLRDALGQVIIKRPIILAAAPGPDGELQRPVCDPEAPNPNPVEAGPAVAPKDENGKFDPTKIADVSDFGDWEEQGCKG